MNTEAEVVQISESMFEAADRIARRFGGISAGDFDSVIVQGLPKSEPIAGGVMLAIKVRWFLGRTCRARCRGRVDGH